MTDTTTSFADHWSTEGYIVVRNLFDDALVDKLKPVCESILEHWRVENPEKGEPGGGPESNVMRHLNHPGYFPADSPEFATLMESVAAPRILELLESDAQCAKAFRGVLDRRVVHRGTPSQRHGRHTAGVAVVQQAGCGQQRCTRSDLTQSDTKRQISAT